MSVTRMFGIAGRPAITQSTFSPLTDTWTRAYRVYHVSGSVEARILLTYLEKGKYKGQNKRRLEGMQTMRVLLARRRKAAL